MKRPPIDRAEDFAHRTNPIPFSCRNPLNQASWTALAQRDSDNVGHRAAFSAEDNSRN
jgi:hypothetical protein